MAAHCNCIAGLGEVCSHIGSILFYCELITQENAKRSVTDVPAYWALPSSSAKTVVAPKKIDSICYGNAESIFKKGKSKATKKDFFVGENRFPRTPIHDNEHLAQFLKKVALVRPNCVSLKLAVGFVQDRTKCFPFVLNGLYKPEYESLTVEALICMGEMMFDFNLNEKDIKFIEKATQRQKLTKQWKMFRLGRITASIVRQACHVRAADSNISLIKTVCYPTSTQLRKKAILWGCEHEKDALAAYLQLQMGNHDGLEVRRISQPDN